jgi:hypothetical protein
MLCHPTDLPSLVAYLHEHPRVYCHPAFAAEQGERAFLGHDPGTGLHFRKVPSGDPMFLPVHRPFPACGKANVGFLTDGFVLTMFGVSIKYEYLSQCGLATCSCAQLTPRPPDTFAWWAKEFATVGDAQDFAGSLPAEAAPEGERLPGGRIRVFYRKPYLPE